MNPTNINQLLWNNVLSSSSADDIGLLVDATLSEPQSPNVMDMLEVFSNSKIPQDKLNSIVSALENKYIDGVEFDLAPFLALFYHRIGVDYLAKYYLGLANDFPDTLRPILDELSDIVQENTFPEVSLQTIASNDFVREYEFCGENKQYSVHSFSTKIGKNCTILKTPYGAIMFDCGAACGTDDTDIITEIELLEFFRKIDISPDDIIAVIISHAHLDHYGSISTLYNLGIESSKIYIENETRSLIEQVATGIPSLKDTFPISAFFVPFQKVKIQAFPNGHILGSSGFVVTFDDLNVVYTGDYCLHNQKTVSGLNVDKLLHYGNINNLGVDCLITETTYGKRVSPIRYDDISKVFVHFVDVLLNRGYKVFIPSFAIGRSQEIALLLNDNHSVLIDGLAAKISRIYENVAKIKIFNSRTRYNTTVDDNKEENFDCNDIIIASSGMLSQDSTSYNYVKRFLECNEKIAIIKTGYISSESYGNELLEKWTNRNDRLFDISLSAHADFEEISCLISELSPKHVVCIHGDGLNSEFINYAVNSGRCANVNNTGKTDSTENCSDSENKNSKENNTESNSRQIVDDTNDNNISADDSDIGDNESEELDSVDNDLEDTEFTDYNSPGWYVTLEETIKEELNNSDTTQLESLITEYTDAFRNTPKKSRTAQRSEKNERLFDAYYGLFSYVRVEPNFKALYAVLYQFGNNKPHINVYLLSILNFLSSPVDTKETVTHELSVPKWTEDSILYVHKGLIICHKDNHNIVPATAIVTGAQGNEIKLTVNYCTDCKKFFINTISFASYSKRYGIMIGNFVVDNDHKDTVQSEQVLADESPLRMCGYSVSQQYGYSSETRQFIISSIIDRGIMDKPQIVRYLEFFINNNGKKKSNSLALKKWREDLNFTLEYEKGKQFQQHIKEIKKY